MSNCLSNDEAKMDPAITNGFGFVFVFRDVPSQRSPGGGGPERFNCERNLHRARLCEEEEGETEA